MRKKTRRTIAFIGEVESLQEKLDAAKAELKKLNAEAMPAGRPPMFHVK